MTTESHVEDVETLRGVLSRRIYQSPDQFYTVAELRTHPDSRTVVVAGHLGGCSEGDTVELTGSPFLHPRFGPQFRVKTARWIPPVTAEGMRRYLAGGSVDGIGKTLAGRIVERFGDGTARILDTSPEELMQVDGIGARRAMQISESWRASRAVMEEAAFFAQLGLGPRMVARLYEELGESCVRTLRDNPYLLVTRVEGIGFRRADEMARALDTSEQAPERLLAGLSFVLSRSAEEGHLYQTRSELVQRSAELLGLASGPVEDALEEALSGGELVAEEIEGEQAIYLPYHFRAEQEVARELMGRLRPAAPEERFDGDRALRWVEPRLGIQLTADQRAALKILFAARLGVLTGGPGVGKTTIVRALAEVFMARRLQVGLAAPTGRAARRLEESSGHPASTLHKLLRFQPRTRRFEHHRDNPLPLDVLLVDEASMIDLLLMRDLLRALQPAARLILIGDSDQLPSVGPGDVLRSVVQSGVVPVARLARILRQKEGSSIVQAAHAVLHGQPPAFQKSAGEGAFFVQRDHPAGAQKTVVELVERRLAHGFGFHPRSDVQVLSPMHRGPLGTIELNQTLKEALNPTGEEALGPGDRVIQTRNNYDLAVFNGEIGTILGRDPQTGDTTIQFEDRTVDYGEAALADVQPAYAITVHKSQGCEFPAVVLVLSMQHFLLLRRNLLYTAITRARRVLVVVGSAAALRRAVEVGQVEQRRSRLRERLRLGQETGGAA